MIIDVWNHESENEQIQFDRFATNQSRLLCSCWSPVLYITKKDAQKQTVIHQSYLKQFLGAKSCMKKKCAGLLYKRTASGLHTFYSHLILFDSFVQK